LSSTPKKSHAHTIPHRRRPPSPSPHFPGRDPAERRAAVLKLSRTRPAERYVVVCTGDVVYTGDNDTEVIRLAGLCEERERPVLILILNRLTVDDLPMSGDLPGDRSAMFRLDVNESYREQPDGSWRPTDKLLRRTKKVFAEDQSVTVRRDDPIVVVAPAA
jgi:hypothetical protein